MTNAVQWRNGKRLGYWENLAADLLAFVERRSVQRRPQVSVFDVLNSFDVLKNVYSPWIAPINPDHDALVDKLVSERVVGTAKKRALKP